MKALLQFTRPDEIAIWIAAEHIVAVTSSLTEGRTTIATLAGEFDVKETVEQAFMKILYR